MPNIPPLISSMPDAQALYASYTSGGGGGGGVSNPMTSSLDGGGYNITNVGNLTLAGTSGGSLTNIGSVNGVAVPPTVLNYASRLAIVSGTVDLVPNTPTSIGAITFSTNYGNVAISLRVLGFAETSVFTTTTTSTATTGDQLSFYLVMNGVRLPQTIIVPFSDIEKDGSFQLNSFADIGTAVQGADSFTATLYALYNSTGTDAWNLTVGANVLTAQAIACVSA